MSKIRTVSSFMEEVRSMLDEDNRDSITDREDILPALNRAQDYATNILSRHYESPLLKFKIIDAVPGQLDYPIPEDAFEERLEAVEVSVSGQFSKLSRINFRNIADYEVQSAALVPFYYSVIGDKFRILPGPSAYPLRLWYLVDPLPLVPSQGRITKVDYVSTFIVLDVVGESLTTEADQLNSYINIINGKTGEVKGSYQIKTISGNKINLKTIPSRLTVEGSVISSSLEENLISEDDLVSVVSGTCVPFFKKPVSNFLVQYAVADLRRKLGDDSGMDERLKQSLEDQVKKSWVGREQSMRVSQVNNTWRRILRK